MYRDYIVSWGTLAKKTLSNIFLFGLQYLVQSLGVNPTYITFKGLSVIAKMNFHMEKMNEVFTSRTQLLSVQQKVKFTLIFFVGKV